jgi:hypothetical protein
MSSLVLYVGVAVSFLTMWGVIMVGAYLLGNETADAPTVVVESRVIGTSADAHLR